MKEYRISLDASDFYNLVRGSVVRKDALGGVDVLIILQDIGFNVMEDTIRRARALHLAGG
jgi:hypothetical protein